MRLVDEASEPVQSMRLARQDVDSIALTGMKSAKSE